MMERKKTRATANSAALDKRIEKVAHQLASLQADVQRILADVTQRGTEINVEGGRKRGPARGKSSPYQRGVRMPNFFADEEVRRHLEKAARQPYATIPSLRAEVMAMFGPARTPSKSALGRYVQRVAEWRAHSETEARRRK